MPRCGEKGDPVSYNIDSTTVLRCEAKMKAADVARLLRKEDMLPESHFLEEMADKEPDAAGFVEVDERFWWSGERSGTAHDFLIKKVAPLILGTVEVIFTWEGGDSHSGLRIVDGKVTKHEVVMALGKEET